MSLVMFIFFERLLIFRVNILQVIHVAIENIQYWKIRIKVLL